MPFGSSPVRKGRSVGPRRVLVPRLMDAANFNPQNSNAQNILARLPDERLQVLALHDHAPRHDLLAHPAIELIRLWRWRFWRLSAWLAYQKNIDAIFYPGADLSDDLGWRVRDWTGRRVPVIATIEGLVGNDGREAEYSYWAGHRVYCQHVADDVLDRIDRLYQRADHVVAISPFLAEMGRRRYGDKFSVLPLGVDSSIYYPGTAKKRDRLTVLGAGRLYPNKRPEMFVELASAFPEVDFVWYGWGELLEPLRSQAKQMDLGNLTFPGPVAPEILAEAMRQAHLFVLPSYSEGVPKVTQEAAACGLPLVIFGYYEAPSVVDGENGRVVWSDGEFIEAVASMVKAPETLSAMGSKSAELAKGWEWDRIVPAWSREIRTIAGLAEK